MRAFRVFFCIKEALTNEVWAINARYYSSFSVSNGATTIGTPNNFPVIKPIIKDDSLRTGIVNRSLSSETSKRGYGYNPGPPFITFYNRHSQTLYLYHT